MQGLSDPTTSVNMQHALPHGASSLAVDSARLIFRPDKMVLSPSGRPWHLTMHFGPESRELDLHLTSVEGKRETHERLFSITHENLGALLIELALTDFRGYRSLARPLRPGWMVRRNISPVLGLLPTDSELAAVTRRGRKGRLEFDPVKFAASIRIPEYIEELYALGDAALFTLFDCDRSIPRRIGIGFKITGANRQPQLRWIRYSRIPAAFRTLGPKLVTAAKKYGVIHKALPRVEGDIAASLRSK